MKITVRSSSLSPLSASTSFLIQTADLCTGLGKTKLILYHILQISFFFLDSHEYDTITMPIVYFPYEQIITYARAVGL